MNLSKYSEERVTWLCKILLVISTSCSIPSSCLGNNDVLSVGNLPDNMLLGCAKKQTNVKGSNSECSLEKPMDCAEIMEMYNSTRSGAFHIYPRSRVSKGLMQVYCDMEDDGGGWTVLQRRGDFDSAEDYFFRDWLNYKNGFGDLQKDFWIGNDAIFALTNQRLNLVKFVLTDWESNTTYATYDKFWIDDEEHNYTLHAQGYRGTAGDSFSKKNGMAFTTKDRDNDNYPKNCAVACKGAWWYTGCHASNLNGYYLKGPHETHADGVNWRDFRGYKYSLKDTIIKIRP
ncbi:Techylectin-5A, partial [Stegodyphus mimosarum]